MLTDFGIAVLEGDSSVTRTGSSSAPRRSSRRSGRAGGRAEFASDLWSLGVTLYVAVEGRSPFERAHPLATLSAVMHQQPAPLKLAGSLGPVIFGLLRKDPAERMSAQEAQTHLCGDRERDRPAAHRADRSLRSGPHPGRGPGPGRAVEPSFAPSSVQDGPRGPGA